MPSFQGFRLEGVHSISMSADLLAPGMFCDHVPSSRLFGGNFWSKEFNGVMVAMSEG